ncbi:glycosyltransferase family 1 protein [Hylemonella gracilis]|uniref:Glycosyltransferase family 1 protein n=1 Tax=Hylemonella gracilis TaxID=80880 RepID=A0A4P6ULS9_9BURK|nr:glycosyltransferase [Hylemonella gracilis]QBK04421.1 glycosyltransferase family 1 protein [Hylemonella gracilis]
MKVVILDTYYPRFLKSFYAEHAGLSHASSQEQTQALLKAAFGTSDFYSRHLNSLGVDAHDLVANCVPLQKMWATENDVSFSAWALRLPHRTFRLPVIGAQLAALPGLMEVAIAQIRSLKPDVLYCQDLSFFPGEVLKDLKSDVRLIVGQIACPLPPESFLKGYDLILTSFPHFVSRLRALGVASAYFRIGFDTRVLDLLGKVQRDIGASFVGGISRHHGKAVPLLEYLATNTPIEFFGYGAKTLPRSSAIRKRHHGEVWGLDMYRALARSRIALNRHIDVAENNANNMRLYEATGVGSLLITDRKDNLGEIFEVGKEVVAYSSQEEAAELIRYYLDHPEEAAAIARAGQARTLREHTYRHRMEELVPVLERHLGARRP